MVNPPTFMYIKTFEDTRKFILENTHINLFVEWGYLGMFASFARVDSAMFILEMNSHDKHESTFIKLNDLYEMKRKEVLFSAYDDYLNGRPNDRVYTLPQSKLRGIKSWPFIYWISDEFREKFGEKTVGDVFDICNGISSGGNNERFYRYHWEINSSEILNEDNLKTYKWVFINKGGGYNKWYGNIWLVFEWANDGQQLKELKKTCPSIRYGYEQYYFKEGLAFTGASSKSLSVRLQPPFCIFERAGKSIFPKKQSDNYWELLAYLNSVLSVYAMDSLNPTVSFQSGDIERIPYIPLNNPNIVSTTKQNVEIKKRLCEFSVIEPLYKSSPISTAKDASSSVFDFYNYENALLTQILLNEAVINNAVFRPITRWRLFALLGGKGHHPLSRQKRHTLRKYGAASHSPASDPKSAGPTSSRGG